MKQLFTILMCLQLILLPIPAAYAKSEGGSVANQLLSLGTTIVGSNLLTTCKFGSATPSILTAFSGSLVYIASEILGAKAQQSFIKVQKDEVKQMKAMLQAGGDLQLKILETKLKDEEKKLSFVKQRKNWSTAVAAIYTAAVVLAVMEGVCFYNPYTTATCVNWGMAACEPGSSLGTSELTTWLVVGAYGFGASSAGGGPISSYGSLLYTGISMMVKSTSTTVGSFYNEPIGRAITLGVAAALSMMVINDLNKIEGDLDSNVKEIKTLIADFKDKTEDPNGINSDKEAIDLANENLNLMQGSGNVNQMAIGEDLNRHCWGKDESGRQTYSEGACSTPIKISKPRYNPNFNLPTLQSIANTGHDMAQAVANGDTAAADIAAASLAANAMRLRQIKDNVLKQFNEQNKK